jgi:hypothetical protein
MVAQIEGVDKVQMYNAATKYRRNLL